MKKVILPKMNKSYSTQLGTMKIKGMSSKFIRPRRLALDYTDFISVSCMEQDRIFLPQLTPSTHMSTEIIITIVTTKTIIISIQNY